MRRSERSVGGRNVGTKFAHDHILFDADPIGLTNRLYFAPGPLQTSHTSFTGRTNLTGLAPLTDGLMSSTADGFISRNVVGTVYSLVELVGRSDESVGIHVSDEGLDFEPVPELREVIVAELTAHVQANRCLGAEHIAVIGPAGENRVRFGTIMTKQLRAFAPGGLVVVLWSKDAKLLALDGDSEPDTTSPSRRSPPGRVSAIRSRRASTASTRSLAPRIGR
jgi:aldehyde:ferredoxin oxidoreductase